MKKLLFAAVGCIQLLTVGCTPKQKPQAPIVIEMQKIPVASIPMGAEVRVDGRLVGVTPTAVELQKNQNHIVTISKDGFVPKNINVFSKRDEARAITQAFTSVFKAEDENPFSSAEKSWNRGEKTGETFFLEPSFISEDLSQENIAPKK
jgi:hypothetical protein